MFGKRKTFLLIAQQLFSSFVLDPKQMKETYFILLLATARLKKWPRRWRAQHVGLGRFDGALFDTTKLRVENDALLVPQPVLFNKVYGIKYWPNSKGDFVIMQLVLKTAAAG